MFFKPRVLFAISNRFPFEKTKVLGICIESRAVEDRLSGEREIKD